MIKAILLAAGQSKRIKSENKLTKLYKKKPLLSHSLKVLHKSKVNKVIIVLGHQQNEVKKIIQKNKKNIFSFIKILEREWHLQ
jgi:molybdenum cofactor cytidylyltransferase